jgi:RNA recognition motif-containing protein
LSGYTPPPGPAKIKGTFRQPIEITPERPRRALHEFMKPSKVNWRNSSRAKHLLESHSSFSQKSSEQEGLDGICPRSSTYYSKQEHVRGESSLKLKERDSWAKEKANSEE